MILPVRAAHNLFTTSIIAYDVTSARVKGRAVNTAEPDRKISGTIQPANDKTVSLLPEGAESDGAQLLHTDAAISFYDVKATGGINRQTYIRHAGEIWKAWSVQNWSIHSGGINRYILTKYRNVNDA